LQKAIDGRIQYLVRILNEIAPESRGHEIVVDHIGIERRGIGGIRQMKSNSLHGRDEGLAGGLQIRGCGRVFRGQGA